MTNGDAVRGAGVLGDRLPSGLVTVDSARRITSVNALTSEWLGVRARVLVGRPLDDILEPPSAPTDADHLPAIAEIVHSDGSRRPVLVAEGRPADDGSSCVLLFDATEQREFRKQLDRRHSLIERTQKRLQLVIDASISFAEAASEGELADVLAATTAEAYAAEESVVFLLDEQLAFRQFAGTNPFVELDDAEELAARAMALRTVLKISGIDEAYAVAPAVGAAFEATGVQSMIIAPLRQTDHLMGILAAFFHHPRTFDEQASPLADALAGQAARAISALRLQQRLEHAAMHDDTTGLPNRRLLEERIEGARRASTTMLGVLFVDLDGFKSVNDRLGHEAGDRVLREVAARLQATVREQDVVARYGGDEFVIVCEVADEDAGVQLAERIRESIRVPYETIGPGVMIGASIGVSFAPARSSSVVIDRLVRAADQAMYRAKYAGGDRIAAMTS